MGGGGRRAGLSLDEVIQEHGWLLVHIYPEALAYGIKSKYWSQG